MTTFLFSAGVGRARRSLARRLTCLLSRRQAVSFFSSSPILQQSGNKAPQWLFIAAPLACILLAGGCLSRPSYVKQSFSFAAPAITNLTTATTPRVLEMRRLDVAAPFDGQSLVYRTGEFSYERDPYAQFMVRPAESFLGPIRGVLINSGLFTDVVQSGSGVKPDATADFSVDQLYGDFRNRAQPLAVLALRVVLFGTRNGSPGKLIFQKAYQEQIPLRARTADALMAGWNQGLDKILAELVADLRVLAHGPNLGVQSESPRN